MPHENEDEDIEQYLIKKIKDAINRLDDQQNLLTKFYPYPFKGEFTSLLKDLETKKNQIDKDKWSSVIRNNLYSLNNLVTEWQLTKNQSSLSSKEVYESCENIKKNIKKMKKEIDGDQGRSDRDGSTRHQGRSDRDGSTHHQEPEHLVFKINTKEVHRWSSRHPPMKVRGSGHRVLVMERDLVMRNVDSPFKVFGVVGVAGIGKTTLCQTVFGRDLVKEHFCPRIWVCLSKQPRDIKNVQREIVINNDYRKEIVIRILRSLGIEDEVINNAGKDHDQSTQQQQQQQQQQPQPHDQIEQVSARGVEQLNGLKRLILLLRLQLTGKRYLIVLDDAWNDDKNVVEFFSNLNKKEKLDENWGEELAYGLPKGCGGTVISSSTSEELLRQMLGEDVKLQYLTHRTDETVYEIFKDAVIGYGEDKKEFPSYLEELKEELLKKCDGNPLAAKLLAKIARGNPEINGKQQQQQRTTGVGISLDQTKQVPAGGVGPLIGGGSGVQDGGDENAMALRSEKMA